MENDKEFIEKRAFRRSAVSLPVVYYVSVPPFKKKLKIRARSKDLSEGGIGFVASNNPSSFVTTLQIELPAKAKTGASRKSQPRIISVKARIIFSRSVNEDVFASGACFVKISKRNMALLKKVLS